MIKTSIDATVTNKLEPTLDNPIAMRYTPRDEASFTGEMIVLFTGPTRGVVIHAKGTPARRVGEVDNSFIHYSERDWTPYKGTVTITCS